MATGHLRLRKSKTGEVSYQLIVETDRDPMTGKRERYYHTVKGTKKQAEAALRKLITELENGGVINQSVLKLGDWMHQWLETYLPNIEDSTRTGYKEKIDGYIVSVLGNIPLKTLKNTHIQQWVNSLNARGLAPKTIKNAYNNLNAALEKAVVLKMIPNNPCKGTELPKLKRYKAKVYDTDAIHEVLEIAKGSDYYLFVLLEISLGLRRGEIAALRWDNVDLTKRTVKICENRIHGEGKVVTKAPKTEAGNREITFGDDVAAALSEARMQYYNDKAALGAAFHDLGYVIRKEDGTPYHPDSLTTKWRRFVKANGLEHIRLHDLRHTNATAMIEAGVDYKVVMQRLGHSDISTTYNTYVHVTKKMDEDAAKKLNDIISNKAASGQ